MTQRAARAQGRDLSFPGEGKGGTALRSPLRTKRAYYQRSRTGIGEGREAVNTGKGRYGRNANVDNSQYSFSQGPMEGTSRRKRDRGL